MGSFRLTCFILERLLDGSMEHGSQMSKILLPPHVHSLLLGAVNSVNMEYVLNMLKRLLILAENGELLKHRVVDKDISVFLHMELAHCS